jgi:hypothetical protein
MASPQAFAATAAVVLASLTATAPALADDADPPPPPPLAATSTGASWTLVHGKHWQLASAIVPAALEPGDAGCGQGMVRARGAMKLDLPAPTARMPWAVRTVDDLQKTTCTRWISRDYPERCAAFDRDRWLSIAATLPTREMDFCIDRFEYPNRRGEHPVVMVAWPEAQALCAQQGKRLCDENEWTFACEGEEATPYPYGYGREAEQCGVDRPWRAYSAQALVHRDAPAAGAELARLWQAAPSGSRPQCASSFGVHDMNGNVDEWTRGVRRGERPTILKGGYWGPVRTRCRPSTRSHDDKHVFYQQGFRCCGESSGAGSGVLASASPR